MEALKDELNELLEAMIGDIETIKTYGANFTKVGLVEKYADLLEDILLNN